MKRWIKITCLLLVMLLLMPVFPVYAEEEEVVEMTPKDIVLLLDCSESLNDNDPQLLCLEACKVFMDTMPSQDARISVIGFGYRGGEQYVFQTEYLAEYSGDAPLVHVLVPLTYLNDSEVKESYKDTVVETANAKINSDGTLTPLAASIAAAVDMLEANGTADGDGAIILVSDGVDAPMTKWYSFDPATQRSGEHDWPIYCVELNYNNGVASNVRAAQELMDSLCTNSGNTEVGRITCETPTDVHVALQKIFCDIFNLPFVDPVLIGNLPAEYTFTIDDLVSEATVNIFGAGIEYVELTNVAENNPIRIDEDIEQDNLIAVVEEGSYYSIKMIVPTSGEWKVNMYGDESGEAQASLLVSHVGIKEMGLTMVYNPSSAEPELIKSDTVAVDAFFEYRDIEVHNSDFYVNNPATLRVYSPNGTTKEYTMEGTKDGYHLDLSLAGLPSGTSRIQVVVEHTMFRNGLRASNLGEFTLKNLMLQLNQTELPAVQTYVNSAFETIDLSQIFYNPDGDEIQYTMSCVSDRTVELEYSVEADYLNVQAGLVPGTYVMEIGAKDPDMTEPLICTATLVVEDRTPVVEEIEDIKLWIDAYPFQKTEKMDEMLDLGQHFYDPDGVVMTFSVSQDGNAAVLNQNGLNLEILPNEKGESVVTVTGTDGVTEVSAEFTVEVVSGKAVYWQQNWIFYVIALAILILIVVTIIIILKNKRVKGDWQIILDENGNTSTLESMNIANYTKVGKKGKFLLKDLISELLLYMDNGSNLSLVMPEYFNGNGAEKIELIGVVRKQGCTVAKIPADERVKVSSNGIEKKGKVSVYGGTLTFRIEKADGFGEVLNITMFLRGSH